MNANNLVACCDFREDGDRAIRTLNGYGCVTNGMLIPLVTFCTCIAHFHAAVYHSLTSHILTSFLKVWTSHPQGRMGGAA